MTRNDIEQWLAKYSKRMIGALRLLFATVLSPQGYTLTVTCDIGGGSYCAFPIGDSKVLHIHIGIPDWFISDHPEHEEYVKNLGKEPGEEELYIYFRGLALHEFMHACITRPGSLFEALLRKFPMTKKNATVFERQFYEMNVVKFFRFLFNCAEDARIENVGKWLYVVEESFNLMRFLDYAAATKSSGSKAFDFGYALLQRGVIGKDPSFYNDQEAKDALEQLQNYTPVGSVRKRNLYDEFLCDADPATSAQKFIGFFDVPKVHEYVAKLLKETFEDTSEKARELMEKFKKQSAKNGSELNSNGSGATPFELGSSVGKTSRGAGIDPYAIELPDISSAKKALDNNQSNSDENQGGTDGEQNSQSEEGESSENRNEASSGESGENGEQTGEKSKASSGEGGENSKQAEEKNAESSDSKKADTNNSASNEGKESSSCSSAKQAQSAGGSESKQAKAASTRGTKRQSGKGVPEKLEEDKELRKAIDETIEKLSESAKQAIKTLEAAEKAAAAKAMRDEAKRNNAAQKNSVIPGDVDENNVSQDKFSGANLLAPRGIEKAAKELRKSFEKAFLTQSPCKHNQDSGKLDLPQLYKYNLGDPRFFVKKNPSGTDGVVYILIDGSGSMRGKKQEEACYACAVIEAALRGICPLKIVCFYSHGECHLVTVKDYDEKDRFNHSYSYGATRHFNGGNRDGLAIFEAVKSLKKRPETNKFLIVLSDGYPSDYNSLEEAVADVKNAVSDARKSGIGVASIFFGDNHNELVNMTPKYKEMYGNDIVACLPERITANLKKLVERRFLR